MAKEVETEEKTNRMSTMNVNHGWLFGVLGVLIILVVFMAGAGIANHRQMARTGGFLGGPGTAKVGMRERGFRTGGGFGGGAAIKNGQSQARGVVTAVNGSDFTLAGNGSTTNVATNSSTQYQDGNQVKQNDTVIVFGTTSNNTLTATSIVINP